MNDIESIDLDAVDIAAPKPVGNNTATEKQIAFINRLKGERVHEDEDLLTAARDAWRDGQFTKEVASRVIDKMLGWAKPERAAVDVPEGMHKWEGIIYKVQRAVHGSGNLYAKQLVQEEWEEDHAGGTEWKFVYAPGAIRNLSEETRLSIEEAKEFGALYGTCIVCGRTLTNEDSIEAGIGPICAGKF